MQLRRLSIALTVGLFGFAGLAIAEEEAASPKPTVPSIPDILQATGLTLTGYVDATYSYQHNDTADHDYSTFVLQQAALTLSKLPTSGFGALANIIAGQNPYSATGFGSIPPGQGATSNGFYVLQAFLQYASGPWTLQAGKFSTLAGAEVAAPVLNTNTTRSILFAFEPVTNTGVRATYAATEQINLILGVNNGWTNSQESADGSGKTAEVGAAFTPSKTFSWTASGYYGRHNSNFVDIAGTPIKAGIGLFNTVVTWSATSALTLVGSFDYGSVQGTSATPSASWYGVSLYANYALNDSWRVSLRPEYMDDRDGYLTRNFGATYRGSDQKLKEITLTLGYDPIKSVELRLEARYDDPSTVGGAQLVPKTYQGWIEAYYKF